MRYGSLFASAAVLLSVAACKGKDAGMNDDLAKDLAAAKTNDAFALAPHAGVQTIVSPQELSPQGRARLRSSSTSSRLVSSRTVHHDVTPSPAAELPPLPAASASTSSEPAPTSEVASATPAAVDQPAVATPRPQPVGVSYPSDESGSAHGGGGLGSILGAIGGAILRGGVVDGDRCDPRGRHGGGTILINHRGPILRGNY